MGRRRKWAVSTFPRHPQLGYKRFAELRVAASGMAWRGEDQGEVTAIPSGSIKWAQWIRVARNYQLRVGHKDQKESNGKDTKPKDTKRDTFDGFARDVCFDDVVSFV